ncbi:MAG: ribosome maturation factor RimM [Gaiellales bacterium]
MSRSSPERPWRPARIVVGRIGRAHGLDGSVYLEGHGGTVPLAAGTRVCVGDQPATVAARRGVERRPILRFDLASTREQADELRGQPVTVASTELPEPEADEYFHVDLIGCEVMAGDTRLGEVADVLEYPANDVLDVRDGENQLLLPFAEDTVLEVDVPGRRIVVREDLL